MVELSHKCSALIDIFKQAMTDGKTSTEAYETVTEITKDLTNAEKEYLAIQYILKKAVEEYETENDDESTDTGSMYG